jgi:methionine-rich copper-binding protein CopC
MKRPLRRQLIMLGMLAVAALAMARITDVSAHAHYDYSVPADNEVLAASPAQVDAYFTQDLMNPGQNSLDVRNSNGASVDNNDLTVGVVNARHMRITLPPSLPTDDYTVLWQSHSVDGHIGTGSFRFIVKEAVGDTDGDTVGNDTDVDDDNDGCDDVKEEGAVANSGGLRNPHQYWDFFDTPDAAGNRDKAISVADISRVVARFGASVVPPPTEPEALAQAFTVPPAAPAYHVGFDRTPALPGHGAWEANAPNGSVTVQDISLNVSSFGHSCLG